MRPQTITVAILIAASIASTQVLAQSKLPYPDRQFQG